jgi:thiol-disulfide isomerase/thioredoxin
LISSIIEISANSFHSEVIEVDKPVAVEFFSNSCPHCLRFRPICEKLSEILKGQAKFVKINVPLKEENKALAHTNEGNKALVYNRGIRSLSTDVSSLLVGSAVNVNGKLSLLSMDLL